MNIEYPNAEVNMACAGGVSDLLRYSIFMVFSLCLRAFVANTKGISAGSATEYEWFRRAPRRCRFGVGAGVSLRQA
jgi:hypothetical protein